MAGHSAIITSPVGSAGIATRPAASAPQLVAGGPGGSPADSPVQTVASTGAGSSAAGGSGIFFLGFVAGLVAFAFLAAPRLNARLRLVRESGVPLPFVLLLDHPG